MEKDVSVRQMAVDLLYAMCDRSNAEEIVQEMLNYLETADYSIREEMVLKVAILAEKYATDFTWYKQFETPTIKDLNLCTSIFPIGTLMSF